MTKDVTAYPGTRSPTSKRTVRKFFAVVSAGSTLPQPPGPALRVQRRSGEFLVHQQDWRGGVWRRARESRQTLASLGTLPPQHRILLKLIHSIMSMSSCLLTFATAKHGPGVRH
ncbi:hypothetical protein HBI16_003590 [Parastagonospora nodorum]|nr:hypothetical protein HBI16_003590 [Parastagonospora nodorum]